MSTTFPVTRPFLRCLGDHTMSRLALFLFPLLVGVSVALALGMLSDPMPSLVVIAVAAGFVLWLWSPSGTAWREAILADASGEPTSSLLPSRGWFLAGFLLLGAAIFLLEW